jgi:hypothetical protein
MWQMKVVIAWLHEIIYYQSCKALQSHLLFLISYFFYHRIVRVVPEVLSLRQIVVGAHFDGERRLFME